MNNLLRASTLFLMLSAAALTACKNNQKSDVKKTNNKETTEPSSDDMAKKGEYIVTITGCNDCHSPKEPDAQGNQRIIEESMLSGYPSYRPVMEVDPAITRAGWVLFNPDFTSAVGPWGVSFAANITADNTGIGNWTEENFKRALKEGKLRGLEESRTLLPPMPWRNFRNMKDQDVIAIFSYLKSTNPVSNIVPADIISEGSDSGNE